MTRPPVGAGSAKLSRWATTGRTTTSSPRRRPGGSRPTSLTPQIGIRPALFVSVATLPSGGSTGACSLGTGRRCSASVLGLASPTPTRDYLDDRTAFDAYIVFDRRDGSRGFVAIETKYTDSFSPDDDIRTSDKKRGKYKQAARAVGTYDTDRIDELFNPKSSQLFRMALLAALWRTVGRFEVGVCLVAALGEDDDAREAVDRLDAVHSDPHTPVQFVSHAALVDGLGTIPGLESWATDFSTRYLDLSPLAYRT